jgi:hypothetical protein
MFQLHIIIVNKEYNIFISYLKIKGDVFMLFNLTEREMVIAGIGVATGATAVGVTAGIIHASNKKRIEAVTGMSYKDILTKGKINSLQEKVGNCNDAKTAENYKKKIDKLEAKLTKVAEAVAEPQPETCESPALV